MRIAWCNARSPSSADPTAVTLTFHWVDLAIGESSHSFRGRGIICLPAANETAKYRILHKKDEPKIDERQDWLVPLHIAAGTVTAG